MPRCRKRVFYYARLLALISILSMPWGAQAQEQPRNVPQTVVVFFNNCLAHLTGEPFETIVSSWKLKRVKKDAYPALKLDKAAWTNPTDKGRVLLIEPVSPNACFIRVFGTDATQARKRLEAELVKSTAGGAGAALFKLQSTDSEGAIKGHYYVSQPTPAGVIVKAHLNFREVSEDSKPKTNDMMLQVLVMAARSDKAK